LLLSLEEVTNDAINLGAATLERRLTTCEN
jgi:hypothetical protein